MNPFIDKCAVGEYVSLIVEILFFVDVILVFFTSYNSVKTGFPETERKRIALNYMKNWLIIDIISVRSDLLL